MQVSSRHIDTWLTLQSNLGRAPNTIAAYSFALRDYQQFCSDQNTCVDIASREQVSQYVRNLLNRRVSKSKGISSSLFANATIRQRITVVRLFYDYLIEEGLRTTNPVRRGNQFNNRNRRDIRAIVPIQHKMPWIPNEEEWQRLLAEAQGMSLRNRLMLTLAYDGGLRREELCLLNTKDIDPSHRLLHIRAETTKAKRDRIVPYSASTGQLLLDYLRYRRRLTSARGAIFISESSRNIGMPITFWAWSKVIRSLGNAAGLPRFSTHTLRHLCLTDLARSGWDLHEIATFAGHRNTSTTLIYIHLSGRELATKLAVASSVHGLRLEDISESLQ
ncbi:site-specific recombinase XerD [Nitrosomonas sp. Nm84]|uniref:tyrosine-type recombinase/integrase n=1 Tax=Nitrosomonas sp. Nm84 TaxID=200124 RepID=UPI000D767721|nr:tyrosine-type recombinase/integrase [Nitrosomonas sp. Nm84]PXW84913.1 site-specific recombinase XerD [Nitrosomonas sp. Nm84]